MDIIEVKNITSSYNGHVAIENITFNIQEKEFICLVGENGSGKSTIIKNIVGLLKKDKGTIKINLKSDEISYLEQSNLKDINFPATAKEIILTGVQKAGSSLFYTKKDYEALNDVCETLHISSIINKRIGDLSGGQRQRVMLARALILKPKLLILDEPCSGLDKNITNELYRVLGKLNKENNTTILMATHSANELQELYKDIKVRVIHVAKNIKYDGTLEDWKGI